jgi:hypothetical protein
MMFRTIKTAEEVAAEMAQQEQVRVNAEARRYLAETDWYVVRLQETGVEIPTGVLVERQAARDRVKEAN